ncbi:hypothetical protein SALWKB12_0144 [Snodgrassella communis]|uniref:Uncharacterized protein n=1 Tax=Snodgrassella communis TaxID=2946699 RepID=A0A836Z655_9NEIS|nr:hypothetical protein SALWKB12_0144 [Snodgrassella communis]KDN15594.1 hypothetical protein SALWKB29_0013 [Snodgrassella communis]
MLLDHIIAGGIEIHICSEVRTPERVSGKEVYKSKVLYFWTIAHEYSLG